MSDNKDELAAVLERLELFSTRLRSRDSGGDEDALIKAQLGSLEFVKKVCQLLLTKLDEPTNEDQSQLHRSISNQSLSNITLEYVLERQIGVSLFLEFLSMMGSHNYLSAYINIVQYQTMYTKITEPVDEIFYFGEQRSNSSDSTEQQNFANKILRDTRILKLNENLLTGAEEKINSPDLSPEVFEPILKEIIEILKEKRHFDTFKRSKYFQQFLDEIDYSCEDSLISEEDVIDATQLATSIDSVLGGTITTVGASDVYNVRIVDSDIVKNSFVLYLLVVIKTDKYGNKATWKTQRRYREFDSFHTAVVALCGRIPELQLPSKKPFNNMTNEFLERRSLDLQEYIMTSLDPKLDQQHPGLRQLAIQFIQSPSYENRSQLNRMQSLVNPLKTVGNAVLSMPDNLFGNINKLYSSISPSKRFVNQRVNVSNILSGDQSDYGKFGNDIDQGKAESIPIRILFLLVDEIFDLQNKSQVVRKGIFGILRKIVKTFFGLKVNKIILEKAAKFTSSDQVAEFVVKFKEFMWPNGKLAGSQIARDHMTKMRTKVLCKTKMLGSVSDEVSQFLGNETTRQGVQRVFDLCQDEILNRRLIHSIMQMILQKIFPGHNLDLLMQYKLCPVLCGKVCDKHRLMAPEWRDWGNQ